MTTRLPTVLLVTMTAVLASGCDVRVNDKGVSLNVNEGGRADENWTRTYTLSKGGRFELESMNGNIDVAPTEGPAFELTMHRAVRARSDAEAQGLLKQWQIVEDVSADRVAVRAAKAPNLEGDSWQRVRVDYRLSVPADATVSLRTENGRIGLDKVRGRFIGAVTNGHIDGRGVSGGLDLSTVNGGIEMRMIAVTSDVRMSTVNGGVLLFLPPDANGMIDAVTVNGGVQVEQGVRVVPPKGNQRGLSARLGTGAGPRIELRTTNGGVRLRPLD